MGISENPIQIVGSLLLDVMEGELCGVTKARTVSQNDGIRVAQKRKNHLLFAQMKQVINLKLNTVLHELSLTSLGKVTCEDQKSVRTM